MKLHQYVYNFLGTTFMVAAVGFFKLAEQGDDALADFGD